MASLLKDSNGAYRLQFCLDGRRPPIRLGRIAQWQAATLKHHVEYLVAARQKGASLPAETSVWLEQLDDDLRGKLTGVGLIEARESDQTPTTLGAFLDAYIARRADVKPATVTNYRQTTANLVAFYGCDRELRSITAAAAADFLQYLVGEGLAPRTIARRIQNARMFMSDAATRNLVASNPFDRIRVKSKKKTRKHAYVPRCDIEQLLTVCDPTWQIIVALSRYAGLRCPSEVLSLRWEMVDFGSGRMVVDSPKTEHHDQSSRTIPIFKALRPILEQARRQALPDAVYVVPGRYRDACLKEGEWKNCNLRTQLRKLISRAGLQPWPVAFHSLRSSCETDLIRAGYPIQTVADWMGHTPTVALEHYLQVTDQDFQRAIDEDCQRAASVAEMDAVDSDTSQKWTQPVGDSERQQTTAKRNKPEDTELWRQLADSAAFCGESLMGDTGFEPVTSAV